MGAFGLWLAVERGLLHLPKDGRLVDGAALVPMVLLGVPHVLIGTLFLATSRKVRSPRGWWTIAALGAAAVLLCALYALAGAHTAPTKIPVALVAIYFIVHELRDEGFFYQVFGEAPAGASRARTRRLLDAVTWVLIAVLAGLATYLYDLHAHAKVPPRLGPLDLLLPEAWRGTLGPALRGLAVLTLTALLVLWRVRRWRREEAVEGATEPLPRAFARHVPMLAVYGLFVLVLLAGTVSGSVLSAIVLWHVMEWFVFAFAKAGEAERAGAPAGTWLERARNTRRGFLTLHLGLSVLVFGLMLVWAYGMGRSGPLTPLVSSNAFYYWTIAHVTLSFFPR